MGKLIHVSTLACSGWHSRNPICCVNQAHLLTYFPDSWLSGGTFFCVLTRGIPRLFKLKIFKIVCMCVSVEGMCVCLGSHGGQRSQILLELELCTVVDAPMWVQGTELGSFASWAICPVWSLFYEGTSLFPKGSAPRTPSKSHHLLTPSQKTGLGFQHIKFGADTNIWFLTKVSHWNHVHRLDNTTCYWQFQIHLLLNMYDF